MAIEQVGVANFEQEVIRGSEEIPTLVAFEGLWCRDCRSLRGIDTNGQRVFGQRDVVEEIEEEYKGRLRVVEFETTIADFAPDRTLPKPIEDFNVLAYPTLMLIVNGLAQPLHNDRLGSTSDRLIDADFAGKTADQRHGTIDSALKSYFTNSQRVHPRNSRA